jgi:prevent-host-death family protein
MDEQFSIAEARHDLAALVRKLDEKRQIQITRRGKTVAMLLSIQEYQRLTAQRVAFWEAYSKFRSAVKPAELQIDVGIFKEARSHDPGREVDL